MLNTRTVSNYYFYNHHNWFILVSQLANTLQQAGVTHNISHLIKCITVGQLYVTINSVLDSLFIDHSDNTVSTEVKYGNSHRDPNSYRLQILNCMFVCNAAVCLDIS